MNPPLVARDLSAGWGNVPVVTELNLTVDSGEIIALMGANGAGKSTTLKALSGNLRPLAGTVEWYGTPVRLSLHAMAQRGLRYVPEERSIIQRLSTLDNLRLGPGPVDEAIEFFPEIKPLLKRQAGLLSGGEQQIVTLARALAGNPKVILADELSLGLAPKIVARLFEALKQAASRGVAVVLVEQQVRSALQLVDRGYVLRRGKVELEGKASDLLGRIDEIEETYLAGVVWDETHDQ